MIKVATYLAESHSNGPECRSVLWVQGCPKKCAGCWNDEFISDRGGMMWTVLDTFKHLTESSAIEGVTFLGGEPFAQAAPLVELSKLLKEQGLGIMAYSGWTLAELEQMGTPQTDLLAYCDLLVDGEYIESQGAPLLWRGSSNQKVHFLTQRYTNWRDQINEYYRDFEIFIRDGHLILTGDPPLEVKQQLSSLLVREKFLDYLGG